jgi:hypothetical protein
VAFAQDFWLTYWRLDFQYFWLAANQWLGGDSPYGAGYISTGQAMIASDFANPFFYPPAILPVLAPLGLLSLRSAALVMLATNLSALAVSAALLSRALHRRLRRPPSNKYLFAAIFAGLSMFAVPVQHAVGYGQITILFMLGASMVIDASDHRRPWLGAVGLTLLLCKPHFGLPLLFFAALDAGLRASASRALVIYTVLSLIGVAPSPFGSVEGFIANSMTYQAKPENAVSLSQGANYLAGLAGLEFSPLAGVCIACILAALHSLYAKGSAARGVTAVLTAAIAFTPSHATDLALLAVAIPAIAELRARILQFGAAAALLILAQATVVAQMLTSHLGDSSQLQATVAANTVGLAGLGAVLLSAGIATARRKRSFL